MPAAIPAEIFAAAVDTFTAGQRLDMRSLARRLGVARATLYRRAGNREQLLDELLWWRARGLLVDQVRASEELAGTERLVAHYPVSVVTDGQGLNITLVGYLGQLHFGLVSCRELVPDIDKLAGYLPEELALLAEAAEKRAAEQTEQ